MFILLIYISNNESYYNFNAMNNLILGRHGQSIWNKQRRFTDVDVNLTDIGKKEVNTCWQIN